MLRKTVVVLVPFVLLVSACGRAAPGSAPSASTVSAPASSAAAEAMPEVPGYRFVAMEASEAATLQSLGEPFGFAEVEERAVQGPNVERVLLVRFSGGTAKPDALDAAASMAFEVGTRAGSETFTEIMGGGTRVAHSAASIGGIGPVFLYSFGLPGTAFWIMSDDDVEGGTFAEALVDVVAVGAASSPSAHAAGAGEPELVPVAGFAYADLEGEDAAQFGFSGPIERFDAASIHRVVGPPTRVLLAEYVPDAELAADEDAMAVAGDLAGTVLTQPDDTVRSEEIQGQPIRFSHFTLTTGGRMYSISFVRDGTIYWLLCDDDTDCAGFATGLIHALA